MLPNHYKSASSFHRVSARGAHCSFISGSLQGDKTVEEALKKLMIWHQNRICTGRFLCYLVFDVSPL